MVGIKGSGHIDSIDSVTKVSSNGSYVSGYAKTNASEGFAESYATCVLSPTKLALIPTKNRLMLDTDFKGFLIT